MIRSLPPLLLFCALCACGRPASVEAGRWAGSLSPMNHPERTTPIAYDVATDGGLSIAVIGPDGTPITTRDVVLDGDTLRFVFDEPEEGVTLRCALGRSADSSFAGRCTDAAGKWAWFTMRPPS